MISDVCAVDVGAGTLRAGSGRGEAKAVFASAVVEGFGLFHCLRYSLSRYLAAALRLGAMEHLVNGPEWICCDGVIFISRGRF